MFYGLSVFLFHVLFWLSEGKDTRELLYMTMHDTGKLYSSFLTILHPKSLKEINMELTIIETSAYLELKRQLSTLSVQVEDLVRKMAPPAPDK